MPNFLCNSNQPSTAPGTLTGKGPKEGIFDIPFSSKYAKVSFLGDLPLAFNPYNFLVLASQTMANKSPPTPQPVGSMSPKAAFAAMAASIAFPPFLRMSNPI